MQKFTLKELRIFTLCDAPCGIGTILVEHFPNFKVCLPKNMSQRNQIYILINCHQKPSVLVLSSLIYLLAEQGKYCQ